MKSKLAVMIFLLFLLIIGIAIADQINVFTNGLGEENLSFVGNQNITRYIEILSSSLVINFTMDLNKRLFDVDNISKITDGSGLMDIGLSSQYVNIGNTTLFIQDYNITTHKPVSPGGFSVDLVTRPTGTNITALRDLTIMDIGLGLLTNATNLYISNATNLLVNVTLNGSNSYQPNITVKQGEALYILAGSQFIEYNRTISAAFGQPTDLGLIRYENVISTDNFTQFLFGGTGLIINILNITAVNFSDEVTELSDEIITNDILENGCICTECILVANICQIPIKYHSDTSSIISYSDLNLTAFTNLTVNIYDRETNNFITDTTNIQIRDFGNSTTTTGTININFSITAGPHTIIASSANYITDQTQFTLTDRASTIIDMYLLNSTSDDVGNLIVNVFDEFFNFIVGANVKLLEYNTDTDSFIEVSQCFSNSNGECIFNVELDTKFYIVQATHERDGITQFAQSTENGEILKIDNTIIELHLRTSETFEVNDLFGFQINVTNEDLVGNTSFLTATFNDLQNVNHTVCVAYYQRRNVNDIELESTCITASAGIVNQAGGYVLDRSITIVAKVYVADDGKQRIYAEYVYEADEGTFSNSFGVLTKYVVFGILLALLALALWTKNFGIFGFGGIGLSLLLPFFDPTLMGAITTVFIIIMCIIIISMAQQRKQ